jgi:putative transposase
VKGSCIWPWCSMCSDSRIVGWAMSSHLYTELLLRALDMALQQRRAEGVIHHSDQGCQGEFNRSLQHL